MSYKGIDVSQHNGTINWTKVAKNVDFAIIRIGWVGNKDNHTLDTKWETNYKNAKAAGVKVGAYVYNYCNSEATAKEGAQWALKQLKGKTLDLPVYFDMEDSSIADLGKTKLTAIVKAFNEVIEGAGFWAGVYANKNWFDNYLENGIEKTYTGWIAHYTSGTDKYKGEFDMWQNSSTGKIDGISGNVDTNYMYRDLISQIGGKTTTTTKKTIAQIAKEVIAGKWGNGDARKKKLEAAGYDYDAVQDKVNDLLDNKSSSSSSGYSNGAKSFDSRYKNGKTYTVKANGGLNLRKGAGTSYSSLCVLPNGSKVTWYGYYTKGNGNVTWKYVKAANGKVGFVSSQYLK